MAACQYICSLLFSFVLNVYVIFASCFCMKGKSCCFDAASIFYFRACSLDKFENMLVCPTSSAGWKVCWHWKLNSDCFESTIWAPIKHRMLPQQHSNLKPLHPLSLSLSSSVGLSKFKWSTSSELTPSLLYCIVNPFFLQLISQCNCELYFGSQTLICQLYRLKPNL